ncbi:unnamed protein product [Ilex paraguariensis]|uniref:Uncharacterized protein n=1 Tax=Ilex paraguariensis TaxID=185542 RepID=A0ABC8RAQ8_9AQUA
MVGLVSVYIMDMTRVPKGLQEAELPSLNVFFVDCLKSFFKRTKRVLIARSNPFLAGLACCKPTSSYMSQSSFQEPSLVTSSYLDMKERADKIADGRASGVKELLCIGSILRNYQLANRKEESTDRTN